jgi:hypothetical protein
MSLSITAFSIMTLMIKGLLVTLSIKDIRHNDTHHSGIQYNNTQRKGPISDTQHKRPSAQMMLSIKTL